MYLAQWRNEMRQGWPAMVLPAQEEVCAAAGVQGPESCVSYMKECTLLRRF